MSTPILDATSFWGLLTARHESSPDHPLLIDDAGRSLTVAEFVTEVEQVAAGFHARVAPSRHWSPGRAVLLSRAALRAAQQGRQR